MVGMGITAVCAMGCGSATLVRDGGAAAGGNGTGGQGGTAGHAPTGAGGTVGGGGRVGTGGVAGGTAGTIGTGGGGASGTGGVGGKDAGPVKSENGAACSVDTDCVSGDCVDMICCNSSCTGSCQSCKSALTGVSDGTCTFVSSGKADPVGTCVVGSPGSCGETGTCDGHGACSFAGSATTCVPASCGSGSFTPASTCDGKGACMTATPVSCQGFACSATTGCATTCSSDSDCTGGYCTSSGTCATKMTNGSTCSANDQCANGTCVGSICCESACGGLCQSCASADTGQQSGLCRPISAGGSSKGRCTAAGTACGLDGTCDGNGACRFGASGTTCGSPACASAVLTGAPTCNGAGSCVTPTITNPCSNALVCASATACKTSCTADTDCVGSGYYCASGTCTALNTTGSTCSTSDQCSSANCRDSICCPAGCTLSCQGCASSVTGSADGTCALRTSNPAGTQICSNACVNVSGTDASNCGSCGHSCLGGTCSAGACQPVELGTVPTPYQSSLLTLAGGYLYSITGEVVPAGLYPQVYQFNPNAPSTASGVLVAAEPSNQLSQFPPQCVMDGKLFWAAEAGQATPIKSCSLGNCAATTATLLTSPGQVYVGVFCDPTTDEIVWDDYTSEGSGATQMLVTIYRAASNGTNMRMMTQYQAPTGGDGINSYSDLGILPIVSDRWFFTLYVSSTQTSTLYYVFTNSVGVGPVSIETAGGSLGGEWTTDTLLVSTDGTTTYGVPLPNGVTGTPAVLYQGGVEGIIDNQNLYGTFSTLPSDAIGKCPLSNCANPTIMFRGQQGAGPFTQDSTAIYWTTSVTNNGYTVWKGAK